ncbi:MAG: GTPase [Candidatus Bathyarchaeia archaeon]
MVTNLPQEAKNKWYEVTLTKNPQEKLRLMQEFLSLVPKHKGTEKLCRQVKTQISELKDEIEKKKQAKKGTAPSYFIEKAGAAQIVILGETNVGRSSLLKAVTNADPEVASYPYTTRSPIPGMLQFKDLQFQLIEAPPLMKGASSGRGGGFQILSLVRNSDGLILMVDLSNDPIERFMMIADELEESRILTEEPSGEVEIQKRGLGSEIQFIWDGRLRDCNQDDVIALLKEYKIRSALVRIKGDVTLEIVEDAVFGNSVYRPTIVIANKLDVEGASKWVKPLIEVAKPLEVIPLSVNRDGNLPEIIGSRLFSLLQIKRIYTKEPGMEHSKIPIVVKGKLNVGELAKMIHSDFYSRFKYARIWGTSAKFPGEKVGLDRPLLDGDIVELHV